jgi:formate-dependent nitrite reductase membrane component NrfD
MDEVSRIVGSAFALGCAFVAVLFALLSRAYLCDESCSGRSWELSAQLWIAVVGLVATAAMTYFVVQRRKAEAKVALIVAIAAFAIWAVVLDAATHGWGHGPVPF